MISEFLKVTPKDIRYYIRNLRHLVFEVTDRCNLNCKYCAYSELYRGNDTREGIDMSYKRAKILIDYLHDLWKESKTDSNNYELAIGFYGGEPLMNIPFIKQVIDYLESFFYSRNCEVIENEMFLQSPRVAWLSDYLMHQSGNNFQNHNELCVNKDDFPMTTGTCVPFASKMFVTVNGKILPCERISQQFSLGKVYEDRVELNEDHITDRHNFYVSRYEKQCVNCACNRFCMQCVYQIDDIFKDNHYLLHKPNFI